MTPVIDISKWQGSYHAQTAKAQGVNEVILRAAYATAKDSRFDTFYAAAKAAGQTIGAYGFATWHYNSKNSGNINTARAAMVEQTNIWIALCKDKLNGWFAIDQELEAGQAMGLNPVQNEILLNECITMLKNAGFVPCVYCSVSWAMAHFRKENINADLWLAYYPSAYAAADFADAPDYKTQNGQYYAYMQSCGAQLAGWQFGSTGWGQKYGCGSENLDRNLFYKTAGGEQSPTPYSSSPIQMKISGFNDLQFTEIISVIGALGIVCDTSTLAEGYFTTDFASSGDQVTILMQCALLGIAIEPYFAPLQETPARLAISMGDASISADIRNFLGGIGIPYDATLLEGYLVTDTITATQQQTILRENLIWDSSIFLYTPQTEPDGPGPNPPEGDKNEQINALLAQVQVLLQQVIALLN